HRSGACRRIGCPVLWLPQPHIAPGEMGRPTPSMFQLCFVVLPLRVSLRALDDLTAAWTGQMLPGESAPRASDQAEFPVTRRPLEVSDERLRTVALQPLRLVHGPPQLLPRIQSLTWHPLTCNFSRQWVAAPSSPSSSSASARTRNSSLTSGKVA